MQSNYPYRKRAFTYIGIVLFVGLLGFGSFSLSNRYPSQSVMNDKLVTIGGLSIVLLVIFCIPFIVFAIKYWKLKWDGAPLPPVDATLHELPVQYTSGHSNIFRYPPRGILSWNNSDKVIRLTDVRDQSKTIFETHFGDIQLLNVELGSISIRVNDKKYGCTPLSSPMLPPSAGGLRGVAIFATLVINTKLVDSAGVPELATRLRAEGVAVKYNQINRKFEYIFDGAFGILFIGAMFLSIFVVH